jgi:hypothetical protein
LTAKNFEATRQPGSKGRTGRGEEEGWGGRFITGKKRSTEVYVEKIADYLPGSKDT